MNIYGKLTVVQNILKAPKSKYNSFGKYNYRNCEDILEAVKPLLADNQLALTVHDEICQVGVRYYIKAVVTLYDIESDQTITTSAYAREDESKKGMDGSQVTGASSSYARKYALNGMFAIDDTKDADFNNHHGKDAEEPKAEYSTEEQRAKINKFYEGHTDKLEKMLARYGVKNAVMLTKGQAQNLINRLEAAKAKE